MRPTLKHSKAQSTSPTILVLAGLLAFILTLVIVLIYRPFGLFQENTTDAQESTQNSQTSLTAEPTTVPPTTPPATPETFSIVAAGDVLPHLSVLDSARSSGGYNFNSLWSALNPWVSQADLAICHLEVPLSVPPKKPSGYPMFGTVKEILQDLKAQGWDGCSTASNHSLDQGFSGLEYTLNSMDEIGLKHAGTNRSEGESQSITYYNLVKGQTKIKIAHIYYTYGTNGIPIPADAPWSVNIVDVAKIEQQAREARAQDAQLVLLSLHAGTEYVLTPNEQQKEVTSQLAASGTIDLVIGHHAHVPQPIEKLAGGPSNSGMWVAYGLGNMISNQGPDCCHTMSNTGLLLLADAVADPQTHTASIESISWTGFVVNEKAGHTIDMLTLNNLSTTKRGLATNTEKLAKLSEIVGPQAPQATTLPKSSGFTIE